MSDTSAFGFGKFVPGFDFLQNLSQTASKTAPAAGAIPGMPSWVAPTLNVEEIDKRIQELKAVQFWLEQNGTALKATIQALEVQKMTLTTLQGMNVSMADLAKAFTAKAPETPAPTTKPEPETEKAPEPELTAEPEASSNAKSKPQAQDAADKPAVDPMAWWGSLTQQFQNIAGAAMKDVAAEAMKAQAAAQTAASAKTKTAKPAGTRAAAPAAQKTASPKAAVKKSPAKKAARKTPARKRPAA
ncbi:PhaM family polyhydroxyalkanoate granule multifunctional regulatory protein [Limnohabitans radicicola]|uniref:Uncharacterized protein n=1 Tax=Limnohabitans radicicola TaxID=2771427 RepID=A0A927FEB7_9BURK|nr:PhaM family polyhydroxyalkanoate granule multifunctional regulatory protein [Limnohabitans radicicola]MBD8049839.1 hypothetical protein [Limnohabitans radicicola]